MKTGVCGRIQYILFLAGKGKVGASKSEFFKMDSTEITRKKIREKE
jgi:hypothetical protein